MGGIERIAQSGGNARMKGTVTHWDDGKTYGFILSERGENVFVHSSQLRDIDLAKLEPGDIVTFEIREDERGLQAMNVSRELAADRPQATLGPLRRQHERHCFVVMPYGKGQAEVRWFKGWYETVIRPTVIESGYEPILAATEERPNAINDEVRTHLALDPMVVVDLGGVSRDSPPNPNVMYELGIRHALSLPLVLMAWADQQLPFDISNQRVIMENRDLLELETNRRKLASFLEAGEKGHFYRPMEAVARTATLELASVSLGPGTIMGALVREVRELRGSLFRSRARQPREKRMRVKMLMKSHRSHLFKVFSEAGGDAGGWGKLIKSQPDPDVVEEMREWSLQEWEKYVKERAEKGMSGVNREAEPEPSITSYEEPIQAQEVADEDETP